MKVTQVMIFITDLKWITSNSVKTSKYGVRDGSVGKVLAMISGIHMGGENLLKLCPNIHACKQECRHTANK